MMLSRTSVFLSASSCSGGLPALRSGSAAPASSHRRRPRPHTTTTRQTRCYAQHAEPDLSWPEPVHPHKTPTPYQILHCKHGHPYSKHRFYALVKLYHPDRCDPSSPLAQLPTSTRLERYRLLVAAHTILADDAKRRAYDAWGHGWYGHHQTPSHTSADHWNPGQRKWPDGHDPIYNATWEDWERWHRRENGSESEPRDAYMTHVTYVALVLSIISLGGIIQGTRANTLTSSVMEHRDKMHKQASVELARSKHATMSGDREERVRTFLEHREAVNAGEYTYQRLLPPAETCAPETAVKKQ